jgi:DNA-binding transcriptional MerR regulator
MGATSAAESIGLTPREGAARRASARQLATRFEHERATPDPGELPIGEMARLHAVSLRTLRFYEDRGLLAPRREGTARYYSASDRLRLQMILKGKHLGFTLVEIGDLIGARASSGGSNFEEKLQPQQIVSQIDHLERQRAEIEDALGRLRETYQRLERAAAPG